MDLKRIIIQIEKLRMDINKSYENSVLTDDAVLKKSRKLDELLNQYGLQNGKKSEAVSDK